MTAWNKPSLDLVNNVPPQVYADFLRLLRLEFGWQFHLAFQTRIQLQRGDSVRAHTLDSGPITLLSLMPGWIYSLCGTPMFQSNGIYDILQFLGLLRYPPVALVDGVHLLDEAVGLGHHGPDPARHGGQHVRLGRLVTRQGQLHLSLLILGNCGE